MTPGQLKKIEVPLLGMNRNDGVSKGVKGSSRKLFFGADILNKISNYSNVNRTHL